MTSALTWFQRIPKVELHLHLEGAIPHLALWELVQKYGGDTSVPTIEHLAAKFTYRDFSHFVATWIWKNQFLREYEDFEFVAAQVARDLARQNIQYVEAFYSPGDYRGHGLDPQRLTEAIRKGVDRVSEIEIALVADLIRDDGPERAHHTLDAVHEVREFGVVGIGIGGSEHRFPPETFEPIYKRARRLGFHTTAHAGEAAGPASVWGAIRSLRVDRLGHATRAVEDTALIDYLSENHVPLELCIISNLRTGVIESISQHPARLYFERGIPLSINTDDPKLFGNSLADEYLALQTQLGFSTSEIHRLIDQAIETSWLPSDRKRDLVVRFQHERESLSEHEA